MKLSLASMAAAVALLTTASAGAVENLGFENGDLSGWDLKKGLASAGVGTTLAPKEGAYLGSVTATYDPFSNILSGILSRNFSLQAGDTVQGWAALEDVAGGWAGGFGPYEDSAYLSIGLIQDPIDQHVGLLSALVSLDEFGFGFASNAFYWSAFSFTAPVAGTYTLRLTHESYHSVANTAALLDGVSVTTAAVPEPGTWAFMIGGFGAVGAALRRRRETVPA